MVPSWAGRVEASLQSICLTSVVMNTMSSLAGSVHQDGGVPAPVTVPPPRPQWLYGDVSCRCRVPTVPDSAGEAVGAAGAPDAGGSSGLPFLEAHAGSFRPACRRQISRLMGAAWASALGPAEKRKRVTLGMCCPPHPPPRPSPPHPPGKKDRLPSAAA